MTPEGSIYLALEIHGLRQLLAEKEAEIERLKAQVKELSEAYQQAIGPIQPAAEIERLKAQIDSMAEQFKAIWETCYAKDAEIEWLKAENDSLIEQFKSIRETCYAKDALIRELAEALDQQSCWSTKVELVQRAREATK